MRQTNIIAVCTWTCQEILEMQLLKNRMAGPWGLKLAPDAEREGPAGTWNPSNTAPTCELHQLEVIMLMMLLNLISLLVTQ
jgi:hypothetical protein